MLWFTIVLLIVGILLSAFFSGSETGFYRASRVRLVMDTMDGDRLSRQLLRLTNQPQWFVATSLFGNNVANYIASLAIVMLAGMFLSKHAELGELLAAFAMAPLLFVYGELLPKSLYFDAPNKLLRLGAPLFLFFVILFAPLSALLWGMGRILERWLGKSPVRVHANLARKEIQEVIAEGHETGLLHETQRYLAQNFFVHATKRVGEKCRSASRYPLITETTTCNDALKIARRNSLNDLPVRDSRTRNLLGYVRAVDLLVHVKTHDSSKATLNSLLREFLEIPEDELYGEALLKMQSTRSSLAKVVRPSGETVGLVSLMSLTEPLLSGPLLSLRR